MLRPRRRPLLLLPLAALVFAALLLCRPPRAASAAASRLLLRSRRARAAARAMPAGPDAECPGRATRNHFREAHGMGCRTQSEKNFLKWRRKCLAVAQSAADKAAQMVADAADEAERTTSDRLMGQANDKFEARLAEIETARKAARRDQADAAADTAEVEKQKAQQALNDALDKAVKDAETKRLQMLADAQNQRNQARDLVLADCGRFLHD